MRAAVQRRFGGPDVVEMVDVTDPCPDVGEVLIQVRATTLNRLDILQREGPALLPRFSLPHIAGLDVAGDIVALGNDVHDLVIGERVVVNPALHCGKCDLCFRGLDGFCPDVRVVGGNSPGGFAELIAVPATHVYRIPDEFSFDEAASVPTIYSTAWHGLVVTGQLRVGEWIMIHAAASGVSTAAIQLAKRMGARVIATAGSSRKLDAAVSLGADAVINNRTDDLIGLAREATGGRGVDMVFDHVGPALFQQSLYTLRPLGRMAFCGITTGMNATFDLAHAYHFGIKLLGVDPYSYTEFAEMLAYYWSAGFQPVIDSVFPLDRLVEAQRKMEHDDVIGKIVVRP
jgi:NADPH:quinone reductase-like Zn-dependent oxidoreductase